MEVSLKPESRTKNRYTRRVCRQQLIAKGILWAAAGITITILLVIIGYVVIRGFIADLRKEYPVISQGKIEVGLDREGEHRIVFIAHKGIRIRDLTMEQVVNLFSGKYRDWQLTEQALKVSVFSRSMEDNLGKLFYQRVIESSEKGKYARTNVFIRNDNEMIESIAHTPGSIGYISAERLGSVDRKKVKTIPIRNISLVVNKEVLTLKDNIKLRYITSDHVKLIFNGIAQNWQEVGGIDLPIEVIRFFPDMHMGEEVIDLLGGAKDTIFSQARFISSLDELFTALKDTPGAVGYCNYLDALHYSRKQILGVERREVYWNLDLPFLIERPRKAGRVGGISTIILNTMLMILLTLLFSAPLSIGAALYLTEYAKQGHLMRILRISTETLAGIPSIIFGLFGYIFFVSFLKLGIGLLSGTFTITLMILPTIIRTSEEAFKAVPMSYREGSLALGATKWQTITGVVIPAAAPGILTGIILGIGRAVGETAALIFTLGSSYELATSLSASARVLSVHLYILVKEGISFERAFATGTILIVIILIVNYSATRLIGRMNRLKG
jgi:phosphate transport system permease protein